ncbi:hypothetical protein AAC387_Pa03g1727 [Persea americana]
MSQHTTSFTSGKQWHTNAQMCYHKHRWSTSAETTMRARIRSMIIGNKSKNLGELLEASMKAETVIKDLNS